MPSRDAPAGDARPARWRFAPTPRQSTYITALVAGPYHSVYDEHDGIPLGIFCRQSLAQYLDADEIFDGHQAGLRLLPRDRSATATRSAKYDQLFVPEFNAGAMENAGCVTFLEDYVFRSKVTDVAYERRAETILHEMAHMWFGDLVTMRWWDDLWLNESFAEYVVDARDGRGDPLDRRAGRRSATSRRPGPTGRTSCPPPTRSRPTSPTSRR